MIIANITQRQSIHSTTTFDDIFSQLSINYNVTTIICMHCTLVTHYVIIIRSHIRANYLLAVSCHYMTAFKIDRALARKMKATFRSRTRNYRILFVSFFDIFET